MVEYRWLRESLVWKHSWECFPRHIERTEVSRMIPANCDFVESTLGAVCLATIPFRYFKLEMAVLLGLAILVVQISPRMQTVPRLIKWTHFGLVGLYSLVGIAGARLVLFFCLSHEKFLEMFATSNLLGLGSAGMSWLALIFSLFGSILFVSAMMLGKFRPWARRLFVALVLPSGILYPVVMLTALEAGTRLPYTTLMATLFFTATGVLSILFYKSKRVVALEAVLK